MTGVTEGHLALHYQGSRGGRDAALLDIAQDHALCVITRAGLFQRELVFKGGTALRKFRAGHSGRFSTDMDFSAPEPEVGMSVLTTLDGAELSGFRFRVSPQDDGYRRANLTLETPLGIPQLGAKVEFSRYRTTLPPETLNPVSLPIHRRYGFDVPAVPVTRLEEAIAEKLARFRRVSLARDLYDLYWFSAHGPFNEPLVRRLWVLKTYRDIVIDGRASRPIDPADVLGTRESERFREEDIGHLTRPVDIPKWLARVHARFHFLRNLTVDEARWAIADPRHRNEVERELDSFRDEIWHREQPPGPRKE